MPISKEQVRHIAKLARLEISEPEQETFSHQLSSILAHIEHLQSWDTTGVEPTPTVLDQTNVFRDDQPRPGLSVQQALANAPDADDGYFRVPKIIGER